MDSSALFAALSRSNDESAVVDLTDISSKRSFPPAAFASASPRRRIFTTCLLLLMVSTVIPYQFAYVVAVLVQIATCTRALRFAHECVSIFAISCHLLTFPAYHCRQQLCFLYALAPPPLPPHPTSQRADPGGLDPQSLGPLAHTILIASQRPLNLPNAPPRRVSDFRCHDSAAHEPMAPRVAGAPLRTGDLCGHLGRHLCLPLAYCGPVACGLAVWRSLLGRRRPELQGSAECARR